MQKSSKIKKRRKRGSWAPGRKHRRHCGRWWQWMLEQEEMKRRRKAARPKMYDSCLECFEKER